MKDVALKAGVSVGTVSRVINNRGSISEKTRQKVFAIMKEMNYQPNEMARYLQTGRSNIIGLVVPYIDHPFFSSLTASIMKSCHERGYRLMICSSDNNSDQESDMISMLRGNQVDGVLVCSRSETGELYADLDLPVVSIERTIPMVPSISCDNYTGGVLAARVLKNAGCSRVARIGRSAPKATMPAATMPAALRFDGFCDECKRLGVEFQTFEEDEDSDEFFTELAKLPEIDGYFVSGDVKAVRLYKALLEAGKTAPQDFKLVGFDGLDISDYFNITTVAQPIREMGKLAVETLFRRIDGEMVPSQAILPVQLIERNSTRKSI